MANNENDLKSWKLIDNKIVGIGLTIRSGIIDFQALKAQGNITMQIELTGSGVVSIEFEQSNNFDPDKGTGDFLKPSSGFSIVSGFSVTSGSGGDGKDLFDVPAFNSKFLRIVVIETGGVATANINIWPNIQ